MELTWRNVFDTNNLTAGTHISKAIEIIKPTGYKYFAFNGDIYTIEGRRIQGISVKNLDPTINHGCTVKD